MIEPLEFPPINPIVEVINPLAFEDWKLVDLDGVVKNYYYVSTFGRVKNIKGHILKTYPTNSGYLVYWLYNGNKYPPKYKLFTAHRLVMLVFHPIENPKTMEVNHKNCDKYFNYEGNLEWATPKDNAAHGVKNRDKSRLYDRRTQLTQEQKFIAAQGIVDNLPYKDIIEKMEIEDTIMNRGILTDIKRGKLFITEMKIAGL